jgi:O-antigen/teichoic acid export membrane protein
MFGLTTVLALAFYLPLAATTPFAAEWIVTTLFSERYASAATALTLLAAGSVFYALALLARVGAIAVGRRAEIAYIAAVALAVNVAANLLVIPRYGIEGAAAVMLATEVVEAALLTALFARAAGVRSLPRSAIVPLLATACLAAVLGGFGLRDGAAVLLAALLYPAALALAARIFAPTETRIALDVLRRRPPQPEHG